MMKIVNYKKIMKSKWHLFLITPLLTFISWVLVGQMIASPNIDERLEILISTEKVSVIDFKNEMNALKDDNIYKINLTCYNDASSIFPQFYSAAASYQDFMILSSSFLNEQTIDNLYNNYAKIDIDYLKEYIDISSPTYLYKGEDVFGIKIYDKNKEEGYINKYVSYNADNDYYLVFGKNSHHIGELNNYKSTAALNLINKLIKL